LTNYEGVMEVASSKAASIPGLVKVSHIHLFGIAFILLFVGRIFIYCRMNVTLKRVIVVIPFLSMLIDTLSWFVTRNNPSFAYVVVASGALMGLSMGAQIVISLFQMWVETFHPRLYLSANQQLLLKKIVISFQQIVSPIASSSKACVLKFAPIIWQQLRVAAVQISLSLYHAAQYQLHSKLTLSAEDQLKARQYAQTLTESGYSVWFAGNGWLVKESLLTWLFFNSINALEHYIQHLPYQQSASTEPSEYKV